MVANLGPAGHADAAASDVNTWIPANAATAVWIGVQWRLRVIAMAPTAITATAPSSRSPVSVTLPTARSGAVQALRAITAKSQAGVHLSWRGESGDRTAGDMLRDRTSRRRSVSMLGAPMA